MAWECWLQPLDPNTICASLEGGRISHFGLILPFCHWLTPTHKEEVEKEKGRTEAGSWLGESGYVSTDGYLPGSGVGSFTPPCSVPVLVPSGALAASMGDTDQPLPPVEQGA